MTSGYAKWQDIPVDELREFASALRIKHTDRGVARMAGISMAGVQNFANGRTQPERRTRRAFATLYMLFAAAQQREQEGIAPLRSVLPDGEYAALAAIDAAVVPGELRTWLRSQLQAEYRLDGPGRIRRPKQSRATLT